MVHLFRWWFAGGLSVVAAQRGDRVKERSKEALFFLFILIFPLFYVFFFNFGLWGHACRPLPSTSWPAVPNKLSTRLMMCVIHLFLYISVA